MAAEVNSRCRLCFGRRSFCLSRFCLGRIDFVRRRWERSEVLGIAKKVCVCHVVVLAELHFL